MSSYLGRMWEFVKWHKKKFIALSVVTGAGVGVYYYAKRMVLDGMRQVEELGRGIQEKMMEQQHRTNELERVRSECTRMITTFVPPLRVTVKRLTDPKPVTEKLKAVRVKIKSNPDASPEEEVVKQLWDELKVVSLTRLIASVYALGLLNTVLRIQLHVLGRNAFEEAAAHRSEIAKTMSNKGDAEQAPQQEQEDPSLITRKVRERFLFSGSDHLMSTGVGMENLVQLVHDCIKVTTKEWLMGTDATVTRLDIINMMDAIRNSIENEGKSTSGLRVSDKAREWIVSCLIPKDEAVLFAPDRELNDEQNKLLVEMLEETLDMVESPNFMQAIEVSFDNLFDVLRKQIQSSVFEVYPPKQQENPGGEDHHLLTKVIVSLKLLAGQVLADGPSPPLSDGSSSPRNSAVATQNEFELSLRSNDKLDTLCTAVFQQGVEESENPLDALGLGDLGIGDDDLKGLASLFGGLGGAGGEPGSEAALLQQLFSGGAGGGGGEANLMKMLTEMGGEMGLDQQQAGGMGGINEAELMQMFQAAGGGGLPPPQLQQ